MDTVTTMPISVSQVGFVSGGSGTEGVLSDTFVNSLRRPVEQFGKRLPVTAPETHPQKLAVYKASAWSRSSPGGSKKTWF